MTKFQIKQIKATGLISKSTTLYPYNLFGYKVVELPSSSHRWRDICHCNLMWRTSTHDKLHRPLTTSIVFSKMLQWRELLNWASNDIVYGVKYHTLNSHFEYLWRCYEVENYCFIIRLTYDKHKFLIFICLLKRNIRSIRYLQNVTNGKKNFHTFQEFRFQLDSCPEFPPGSVVYESASIFFSCGCEVIDRYIFSHRNQRSYPSV